MSPERPDRLRGLDGLRALAVIGVLAFHDNRLSGGFLGVDLFFALSGFLITSLLIRECTASGRIDLDAVTRDLEMDRYARIAADKAFSFAYNRLGVTAEQLTNLDTKNRVLDYAVAFLNNQYPEVIKWIDTDQDGVIDWVESRLFLPEPVALKDMLDGSA
ncbi:MAG: acyltransferase [Actinobacteria bacterium]|nr:acyltransferase [Actinomycetota bacterium]